MLIRYTEKQLLVRDAVRKFTQTELAPRDRKMDNEGFDREIFQKMAELGYFAHNLPEEYGGANADHLTTSMIIEEIAKGCGAAALITEAVCLSFGLVHTYANEEQKKLLLPLARKGGRLNFALTEPGGGSDAAGIRTNAVRQADGSWILNGEKAWITNNDADYSIICAKTKPDAGARGISAFIIPAGTPGLTAAEPENKVGMRGVRVGGIALDNVHVGPEMMIGEENRGFGIAMGVLDVARVNLAACSVGIAEHAYDIARTYANERKAFGQSIGKFEGISYKIAEMASRIRMMRLMVYDSADNIARPGRHSLDAAQTKLYCTVWATEICREAMSILGANGTSRDFPVEQLVRDAKMNEIADGTPEILRFSIGAQALKG